VVFGLLGFIIGPVIAALFMTFIDIYSTEFRDYLEN
jgi:predicted PurR-regulated permease PerM